MEQDILIKNAHLVLPSYDRKADILIKGGVIKEIGQSIQNFSGRVIDAKEKIVLPGIIDAHVQLESGFLDTVMTDDFSSGTIAAAYGGVTTFIDFAVQKKGQSLSDTLKTRRQQADPKVHIDYSLHLGLTDVNDKSLDEVRTVIDNGVPSFKLYMAYGKRGRRVNEGEQYQAMKRIKDSGGFVGVHAENDLLVECCTRQLFHEGKTNAPFFALSRPWFVEVQAIETAILLSEATGCDLYIHHLSTARGLDSIRKGRERGLNIFAETCPHYLLLTDEVYRGSNAEQYAVIPPLRKQEDIDALWKGIQHKEIQTVATDHCSYKAEQKIKYRETLDQIPAGFPGIELLLPLMYTEGVQKSRITIQDLVLLLSYNPAIIFGLHPRKGEIRIGADADIVIFNPAVKWQINPNNLKMNVDVTPFDKRTLYGRVEMTILRGMIIYEAGDFQGQEGKGEFIQGYRN